MSRGERFNATFQCNSEPRSKDGVFRLTSPSFAAERSSAVWDPQLSKVPCVAAVQQRSSSSSSSSSRGSGSCRGRGSGSGSGGGGSSSSSGSGSGRRSGSGSTSSYW